MKFYSKVTNWFGQKAFNFALRSMKKFPRDTSHPEKSNSRSGLQANIDAQALRQNSDVVSAYTKAMQSGVVGTGFTLQYKSEDEDLNNKVESWLAYWSEFGNCEITGRFYRQSLERFMTSEAAIKGGFLVRHHWDKTFDTLYNMEILSTDTIDRTKCDFAKGLYNGVQTNKKGKISGIYIYNSPERMASKLISMKNITMYLNIWTDPHQYTNVTPLAPILNTLDKLATYTDAEVKGAKGRAEKSVIIATEAYAVMLEAQKEFMEAAFKTGGQDYNNTGYKQASEDYQDMLASFSANGIHPGATPIMPGENTQVWDLKQSGDTIYADININSKQNMARALGLAASTVMGLAESSYNVALKNAQSDEAEYAIMGQDIVEIVLKRVYRSAIEAGHILGVYTLKDYYSKRRVYDSYIKITRKQKGHIDPLKQNLGDAAAIEVGNASNVEQIANRGKDYMEVINEQVQYEKYKKKAFEDEGFVYIQTGTEKIALENAKNENKLQDEEESKTSIKANNEK